MTPLFAITERGNFCYTKEITNEHIIGRTYVSDIEYWHFWKIPKENKHIMPIQKLVCIYSY